MKDSGEGGKASMSRLKTEPFERNLALTRLGLNTGGRFVAHSLANVFRNDAQREEADRSFYVERAEALAESLGQLKGSVMKAGQMLSLYGQYFLPPEAVAILSGLQDDTPAVHWSVVAPVLERALGRSRLAELEIDETPMAAASLGQAHRARRHSDGLELVVKIQYPGVADAIESDIRSLSRLVNLSRLAPKGLDLEPIFNEVREMLHREVDYEAEAHFTRSFGERLAEDPRFVVPQVLSEYSTDRVLTTSFEAGVSVRHEDLRALSHDRRNRLGGHFLELFLREFFDWGMVQTDPHFGNYRIRIDDTGSDRIVLLDFGATRTFGRGFIEAYGEIVAGALEADEPRIHAGSKAIGLMDDAFPEAVLKAFSRLCMEVVEPFLDPASGRVPAERFNAEGAYRWGASDLPLRAWRIASRNALSRYFRVPPREIVFLHRRLAGVFIMLSALDCDWRGREQLLTALQRLR
jgi:predicted unusual protein kinase regulating ubiquinone biosynthesis (AarF/ABC1/UbiB family)